MATTVQQYSFHIRKVNEDGSILVCYASPGLISRMVNVGFDADKLKSENIEAFLKAHAPLAEWEIELFEKDGNVLGKVFYAEFEPGVPVKKIGMDAATISKNSASKIEAETL